MMRIDGARIRLEEIEEVARGRAVELTPAARDRMQAARDLVERIVADQRVVYGVNTGFGKLADYVIPPEELEQLQLNLVRSHACGVGPPLSREEARAMTLLRANVLALGVSGARPEIADALVDLLNSPEVPVIPERGSVGASGDLAPLAHLALALLERGVRLQAKEGLALLNGTQAMGAVGGLAVMRAERVARAADCAGAMTLEALLGTPVAFDARMHAGRPHPGQQEVAGHLRLLLEGSEIRESHLYGDPRVQDAYSLRCMPQVHGAVRHALTFARDVVERETASATDNPLVFVDTGEVLSGGNFHGAPLAHAFDFAAIALADLAGIIERRIDRLVNPDISEGLPPFLTSHPGTSSGFMMAHVTAVALFNEMKVLAHPAGIDNVPTSGGKEDHVSMGMTAALKLRRSVELAELVVAIELLCAAEGLEYRRPLRAGHGVERVYEKVRAHAARLEQDRSLTADIEAVARAVREGEFHD